MLRVFAAGLLSALGLGAGLPGGWGQAQSGGQLQALQLGAGGRVTHGAATFTPPPGWSASRDGASLRYRGEGGSQLILGLPAPLSGDPVALVTATARSTTDHATRDGTFVVVQNLPFGGPKQTSAGLRVDLSGVRLRSAAGTQAFLIFGMISSPSSPQVGMTVFLGTTLERFAQDTGAVDTLLESVSFGAPSGGAPQTGLPASRETASQETSSQETSSQQPGSRAPAAGASQGEGTLPPVAPMNAAQFTASGGDPERQLIPDEFRCYAAVEGSSLTPELRVQVLPGGRYRTAAGGGGVAVTPSGSLNRVGFSSGPLAGSSGYLKLGPYGQAVSLRPTSGPVREYECYQRGAREDLALRDFALSTPKEGAYACVLTDGSGRSGGTLEVLPGASYRFGGQGGRYRVNFRTDQDGGRSLITFVGGPLSGGTNTVNLYREDDLGMREWAIERPGLRCQVLARPSPAPRYGSGQAPAAPQGGELSGAYVSVRPGILIPLGGGGLASECPGNLCWNVLVFSKSGYVYTEKPEAGLDEADCTRTLPNGLPVCETYRVQGGSLVIGRGKPAPFRVAGKALEIGKETYQPLAPLTGLRLSGTYASQESYSAVLAAGGTTVRGSLSFGADGNFSRDRQSSTAIIGGNYAASGSSQAGTSRGRYEFRGNTLILTYADGRVERLFAAADPADSPQAPRTLRLGKSTYFRQGP